MVTLLVPLPLQRYSDGESALELVADTAAGALEELFHRHPGLRTRVLDHEGALWPYLLLFKNGAQLARTGLAEVRIAAGDTLDLIGAVEGGSGLEDVRMRGFRERVTVEVARAAALLGLAPLAAEEVSVEACAGRVLAAPITSAVDVPPFARSAMDGFAVRAADTFGASLYDPLELVVVGESMPGAATPPPVGRNEACRIMTGARLPAGADAVLMAEDAEERDGAVLVRAAVTPEKNVGHVGEDIARGERILEAGRWLRPQDAGLLASIGAARVAVVRRPRVRVLVTGNELLPPGSRPEVGRIVDSNTPMLAALVARDGGELVECVRTSDERDAIRAVLERGGVEVLLAAGGSSVGREDFLPLLIGELGELHVHGVAMRPSAPTGVGDLLGARVFLLPGNPVSCLCAYDFFAGPALRTQAGLPERWPYPALWLPLERRISSKVGRLDYVRVRVRAGRASPLAIAGAAVLSSTTRAEGFAVVPADSEGVAEGERVLVYLYDPWPLAPVGTP